MNLSSLSESAYGFSAITDNASELKGLYPDLVIERPTLEEIFLAKTEVRKLNKY